MATAERRYNYSRQREVIYRLLAATTAHPTAEWLYSQARHELPNLSLGTVYRNLQILRDQGRVKELQFGDEPTRYDAMMEPHHHFICSACGAIMDVRLQRPVVAERVAALPEGVRVNHVQLEMHGVCADCLR